MGFFIHQVNIFCGIKIPKNFPTFTEEYIVPAEIMTRLLKIIHRPCCEQFYIGTIFSLQ